jgi:hypothetical protein
VRRALAATCSALAPLGGTAAAHAGPPGEWTRVTGVGRAERSAFDAGLARTPDGALHLLFARRAGAGAGAGGTVLHTALSASARRLRAPDTVASFAGGVNGSVALVAGPGGLRAFFAGLQEGSPVDRVLATSASGDGRAWTTPAPASGSAGPYAAAGIAAALGADGTPFAAWGAPIAGHHAGHDPAAGDGELAAGSVSDPGLGVDALSGQVVAAWNQGDADRVVARSIAPSAGPIRIPSAGAPQPLHRVAVTGRLGASGVYVAYAAGANEFTGRAAVWRFGAAGGAPVSSRGARHVSIAAAPGGRLWVFWDRDRRVYARRSNPSATRYGRLVSIPAPARTQALHDLAGEGSRGPLDVLALVERAGAAAEWHQRLLPGLALAAPVDRGGVVTLTASDAGEPVRGALVAIAGVGAKRTGRGGMVRFRLSPGRYRATATRKGYSPASGRVRVKG